MKQNGKQSVGDRASMAEAHAPMRNLASFSKMASAGKAPSLADKIKAHLEQEAREEASQASVPVRSVSLAKLSRQLTAQSSLSAKVRAKQRESQAGNRRGSAAAKAAEKLEVAKIDHETHLDEHLGHTRCTPFS